MTDGTPDGTNGEARFKLGPWGAIALFTLLICIVNSTSILIEDQRGGKAIDPLVPFILEGTSAFFIVLLAPLVGLAARRWPFDGPGLWTSLCIHAALTVPFSLAHVIGMLVSRKLIFAARGSAYEFFGNNPWIPLLYEWRKDVISYMIIAGVFTMTYWVTRQKRAKDTSPPERIEVQEGRRTLFLSPADIAFLEAAGNYVEIHTLSARHLVRGTLADWEQRLSGCGFVRIHRSRLINRTHVGELEKTGSGDFEVTLTTGRKVQGSRRFRAGLG